MCKKSVQIKFEGSLTPMITSVNGEQTDEEIYEYYKVGKEFNISFGVHDEIRAVESVEILK